MEKRLQEQLKNYLNKEENPIRIKTEDGIIQLIGFAKYVLNGELIYALKIKHENKEILFYKKDNLSKEEKKKLQIMIDYFYTEKKYIGYNIRFINSPLKEKEYKKIGIKPSRKITSNETILF